MCGDLERAYPGSKDYWIIDASIACQNMTLAAHGLGLGSVWLGTYPEENKFRGQAELFTYRKPLCLIRFWALDIRRNRLWFIRTNRNGKRIRLHYEAW